MSATTCPVCGAAEYGMAGPHLWTCGTYRDDDGTVRSTRECLEAALAQLQEQHIADVRDLLAIIIGAERAIGGRCDLGQFVPDRLQGVYAVISDAVGTACT